MDPALAARAHTSDLTTDRIHALASLGREMSSQTAVFVLASLKDREGGHDVINVQTEFLSEIELEQIVGGFRGAGFYCDAFIDEGEFCRWASASSAHRFPFARQAVYAIAQPGRGASRHAALAGVASLFGYTLLTPPPYESCLASHKAHATALITAAGVPTPATWCFDPRVGWLGGPPPVGEVVLAKPALESASIGVGPSARFGYGPDGQADIAALANSMRQPIVVQQFISGWEVEVGVFGGPDALALGPVGISVKGKELLGDGFLDYATVYHDGYDFYDFERQHPSLSAQVRSFAARAVTALGLSGASRIDFRITESGEPYVMDVAGKPHLTRHSSIAYRFKAMGLAYEDIFAALVGSADARGGFQAP